MKITNKFNVPETLLALASKQYYSKGKADFSVTEIISPPRIQRLRTKHYHEMEQDVSDMLWSLLGSALHVVAERSEIANHVNEERLFLDIDGVTLSGAIDLQHIDGKNVEITDYKFTSAWALRADKIDWAQQQNIYGYMVEKLKGLNVTSLRICAFVRDWSRREAQRNPDYPQAPIQIVHIPLWPMEETEKYIKERIDVHRSSKVSADWDEELPECTSDERWIREEKFALKKEGRKTAVKLFDDIQTATVFLSVLKDKDKHFIEHRKGEPIRCVNNFCGVNQWCNPYKKTEEENENE